MAEDGADDLVDDKHDKKTAGRVVPRGLCESLHKFFANAYATHVKRMPRGPLSTR